MKRQVFFVFFLFAWVCEAQESTLDTIRIPEVSVSPGFNSKEELQSIEPMILQDPINVNLADALSRQSAVYVKSYGIGSLASLSLRGAGANHSNVLWNGILLNSSSNGQVDLSLFPSFFLDEVEISDGNSSLSSASGGLGGALLLNSSKSALGSQRISLQQQVGSFGQSTSQGSYVLRRKKVQAKTRLWRRVSDNNFEYRNLGKPGFPIEELEQARLEQWGVKQDLYYQVSAKERMGIELWYIHSDRSLPTIFTLNNVVEQQKDEIFRSMFSYERSTEQFNLKLATALMQESILYDNLVADLSNSSQSQDWKSYLDYSRSLVYQIQFNARINFDLTRAEQAALPEGLERKSLSLFAELSRELGQQVKISAASRQEYILKEDEAFLPNLKVEIALDRSKNWMLQSTWGRNWKYPSLNDLFWVPGGNPNLEAERSETVDLGLKLNKSLSSSWNLESGLNVYRSEVENYIQWRPSALGYWQAENLGEVFIRGLEAHLKLKDQEGTWKKTLLFNYAYTQAQSQSKNSLYDESVDKQLIYIPEHKYALTAELEHRDYFVNYSLQFTGARYTSSDNVEFLPYYLLHDVQVGKRARWNKHEMLFVFSILNASDEEYQAIEWRPMPGRNYLFSLKYNLHEQ